MNYYNEIDKSAANWLRQLIKGGLIPPGDVDERSIVDVKPEELKNYVQCHFFCGIAGWPLALQLAQWPTDRPVWTGSCPCQPFSAAGKGLGQRDERHLWPAFFNLIRECRPQHVFGEQVASAIGHGWLDGVSADLEPEGYACGANVLGAHSVGAPHIRQRLYWVANSLRDRSQGGGHEEPWQGAASVRLRSSDSGDSGRLANSLRPRLEGHGGDERDRDESGRINPLATGSASEVCAVGGVANPNSRKCDGIADGEGCKQHGPPSGRKQGDSEPEPCGELSGLGITDRYGRVEGFTAATPAGHRDSAEPAGVHGWMGDADGQSARWHCGGAHAAEDQHGARYGNNNGPIDAGDCVHSFWSDSRWLLCRDGKNRRIPTQPALFPLADGLPYKLARRGSIRPALLKGAGNAIVPQVAAEFVTAFMEIEQMNQQNTIQ
jgi:DNA (cytosine-5)-methyltransferase 1